MITVINATKFIDAVGHDMQIVTAQTTEGTQGLQVPGNITNVEAWLNERETEIVAAIREREYPQDLKNQYQTAITRLDEIITGPLNTNAKVIAAVVDLAKANKRMLKVLRKLVV